MEKTIDGYQPEAYSYEPITLYLKGGIPVSGVLNHYGSEHGWQFEIHGPHVKELYRSRRRALLAARKEVAARLRALDKEIAKCSPPRRAGRE